MRVAHRLLRSAVAAGVVSLAAACVIPPPGIAPRPEEEQLAAPDVAFYNFDEAPYGAGSGVFAYSVTRESYAAVFEVDQRGRVSVLAPASPRETMRTLAGKNYLLYPQLHAADREFLSQSTDFSRVPFVFVITSDSPLDLSDFGTGRMWSHEVKVATRDPDSTIVAIAERVIPDAPAYGSDYAYIGPQLRGGERLFASQCARPLEDVHDYIYYRDMWSVFTPTDQRLSVNPNWLYTPVLSWSSFELLPLVSYRARFAPYTFYLGCSGGSYFNGSSYAYSGYPGYGPGYGYPYGYPYGYGYPYPTQPGGTTVAVKPLLTPTGPNIPRTPNAFGTTQIVGVAKPGASGTTPTGQVPERFGWRSVADLRRAGERPGEMQPMPRAIFGENRGDTQGEKSWYSQGQNRPGLLRPRDIRPFEPRSIGNGTTRVTGVQASSEPRPTWSSSEPRQAPSSTPRYTPSTSGGQTVTRAAPTFSPPAAAPVATPTPSPSSQAGGAVQARSEVKSGRPQ